MSKKQPVTDAILKQGMLPLFYYQDVEVSIEVTRTLYRAGIRVLEYTNRGDKAHENFKALKEVRQQEMPGLHLGIGTIKSAAEAAQFIAAGADFIVAPIINPEVAKVAGDAGLLWIPGCMTPTEIYTAQQHGAAIIKIFPANILGPSFISSIKELFRGQLFIPTGGVEIEKENIRSWFTAGVCAVGMGSKMISKEVLERRLYDQLYADTVKAMTLVSEVKI